MNTLVPSDPYETLFYISLFAGALGYVWLRLRTSADQQANKGHKLTREVNSF